MDSVQFLDVTVINTTCILIQVTCGYRSLVDTGQFDDVISIGFICIWIQVICRVFKLHMVNQDKVYGSGTGLVIGKLVLFVLFYPLIICRYRIHILDCQVF